MSTIFAGLTYFFKGKHFWRFDNSLIQTERQYPKLSSKEWLGCA
jgi:Hemopexin